MVRETTNRNTVVTIEQFPHAPCPGRPCRHRNLTADANSVCDCWLRPKSAPSSLPACIQNESMFKSVWRGNEVAIPNEKPPQLYIYCGRTLVWASLSAPRSKSRRTQSVQPPAAAWISAVNPSCAQVQINAKTHM